jgi:eukaryotic-like serine/threonine-protein kinase
VVPAGCWNGRYVTGSALAGEVRHFPAREPVAARPPTATYRLGKFIRHHRGSLAEAACFLGSAAATRSTLITFVEFYSTHPRIPVI